MGGDPNITISGLACRWWPNIECWLGSFVIFRGSRPVLLRNSIFLWFFRGGSGPTVSPPPLWIRACSLPASVVYWLLRMSMLLGVTAWRKVVMMTEITSININEGTVLKILRQKFVPAQVSTWQHSFINYSLPLYWCFIHNWFYSRFCND